MTDYDVVYLGKKAQEMGFVRDTLEKVMRLADILEYLNTNPILKSPLALKGGTAINLTFFNLPRLSVDIDLDYLVANSKQEMLEDRKTIHSTIERYMVSQGYTRSKKTKHHHSLESFVYDYLGASGNKDNIKIEINYSLRSHLLEPREASIIPDLFSSDYRVKTLAPLEIYAGKINALLNRAAPRDLYDVKNMIEANLFDDEDYGLLRKCVVFYAAVSANQVDGTFDTNGMDSITERRIKTELLPVLKRTNRFDLNSAKNLVKAFISDLMTLTSEEREFLLAFQDKVYKPELLFEDEEILERIQHHPMALWKTR